ncbi:glutathione S-transferase C-terminal domain-containing protein [Erythrobacter rubeus]|uniref:Glutathione S-transferase C-terminal domain-containing protein n=1 Tax=Erythrobacter rubeus TaxID=2760803 RepID=A0ABR8KUJ1_9SPHN|nr:glutathione S-transferase C-terminal domain-containing protein [Erythrobacter rubeus]MBD2841901.1 glutathione S-transferase C-terminal domain-containing protein [Erythrobacter rubeus]
MTNAIDTSKEESQQDVAKRRASGEFVRGVSKFRDVIGESEDFPAEPGRYHLFVALNCPWCHRVTLAREVLGLTHSVSLDIAYPNRTDEDDPAGSNFWHFAPDKASPLTGEPLPECTEETATEQNLRLVPEIYALEGSEERSVPILYDKKTKRIVSNESSEIVRMFGLQADALGAEGDVPDLYPQGDENAALRSEIDELNDYVYVHINNGSYKAGFSSDQSVYDSAFEKYFAALGELETRLASDDRPFLTGDRFTEADLRLFPTLFRHDPVYYVRMKLNGARVLDYPHLWRWLCRVYALPGVAESGSLIHCRQGYFGRTWNRTIPAGPMRPMSYPEAYRHPTLAE